MKRPFRVGEKVWLWAKTLKGWKYLTGKILDTKFCVEVYDGNEKWIDYRLEDQLHRTRPTRKGGKA